VPVPRGARPERQLEPLDEPGPHLLDPERVGHVIVLHPGQVPAQPRDRVRVIVQAGGQLGRGQTVHRLVHGLLHPSESIGQNFGTGHSHEIYPNGSWCFIPAHG
jgi:hypothetical protein